ncbi:MAG: hypothetical protein ACLQGP_04710 [Isosphaeraceae bacterium]
MAIAIAWPGPIQAQPAGAPATPLAPAAEGTLLPSVSFDDTFEEPAFPPPTFDPASPPRVVMGPLEVMRESIFGPASPEDWKPLTLGTFFSEGWDEPFTRAPAGTNGAPKQNWDATPSGIFGRYATLDFYYTNALQPVPGLFLPTTALFVTVHPRTNGNQYALYSTFLLPLSARLQLMPGTTFISDNTSSPGGHYVANWGDTGVQVRFHLIEQRNFSVVAFLGERIPTGKSVNGNDINLVTPGLESWWNFAPQWVLRGGSAINILTGRKSATSVYANQLSIGRYLTTRDARFFKETVVHATFSAMSDISGGDGHITDVYVFPGVRFGLGNDQTWYVMGRLQVPLTGPRPFTWQPQFSPTRLY